MLVACGGLVRLDDCDLRPIGMPEARLHVGPSVAMATTCAAMVEVDGRIYKVGEGRWLDEDALVVQPYSAIARANARVIEPVAYAIEDVDPRAFLLMLGEGTDEPFMALWGPGTPPLPDGVCRYADATHPEYPTECG